MTNRLSDLRSLAEKEKSNFIDYAFDEEMVALPFDVVISLLDTLEKLLSVEPIEYSDETSCSFCELQLIVTRDNPQAKTVDKQGPYEWHYEHDSACFLFIARSEWL